MSTTSKPKGKPRGRNGGRKKPPAPTKEFRISLTEAAWQKLVPRWRTEAKEFRALESPQSQESPTESYPKIATGTHGQIQNQGSVSGFLRSEEQGTRVDKQNIIRTSSPRTTLI